MKSTAVMLIGLVMLGCGSSLQSLDASKRARTFPVNYEAAFNAILAVCAQNGYNTSFSDKASGVINTEYKVTPGFFDTRSRLGFYVKAISQAETRITAVLTSEFYVEHYKSWETHSVSESEAEKAYSSWFSAIQSTLGVAVTPDSAETKPEQPAKRYGK